jgi:hypothetical protein
MPAERYSLRLSQDAAIAHSFCWLLADHASWSITEFLQLFSMKTGTILRVFPAIGVRWSASGIRFANHGYCQVADGCARVLCIARRAWAGRTLFGLHENP